LPPLRLRSRSAWTAFLCASTFIAGMFHGVPAFAQLPTCQIQLDQHVLRAGTFQVPYTGTDTGVNNSGVRLTPMGRAIWSGVPYTVWRVRNTRTTARRLVLASPGASITFQAAARSELYVRSEITAGTATHSVSSIAPTGNLVLIDSQAALNTTWTDTTAVPDALCSNPKALWLAHSRGLYRLSSTTAVVLDVPVAGGVDVVTTDAPFSNAWAYTSGILRGFAADGTPLVSVTTVPRPAGTSPRLAVDGTGGVVWLALGTTLYRLNYDGSIAGQVVMPGIVTSVQFDSSRGQLWATTHAGFSILRAGAADESPIVPVIAVALPQGGATSLVLDPIYDAAWIATPTALARYDALGQLQVQAATNFAPMPALAADGLGGVWGIRADSVAHFGANAVLEWQLNGIGVPDGGGAISIASNPTTHEAWVISPTDIRSVPVQQVVALIPAPLPAPGVVVPRTARQLEFFTDRAGPLLQFVAPAANSSTNNRRPTLQVSYADQTSSVNTATLQFKTGNTPLAVTCSSLTATSATCTPQQDLPEGSVDLSATVSDQEGNPSSPAHRHFVVDVTSPIVSITAPSNGGYTNLPEGPLQGSLNEPGTLAIDGVPTPVDVLNNFSAPVTLTEGVNTRAVVATDRAGNTSIFNFSVTLDTQPPSIPAIAQIVVGTVINGSVAVSGNAGAVEAAALVRVTNLRTNEVQTVSAGANGAFTIALAAEHGDNIHIEAVDAAGNVSPAAQIAVSGGGGNPQLSIAITEPSAGLVTSDRLVLVRGTVSGDAAATVVINSTVAATSAQGTVVSFSALVALNAGANTLDVRAATNAGLTAQASRAVTRNGDAPFAVTLEQSSGLAPMNARFEVAQYSDVPFSQVEFDYDGDGTYDETLMAPQRTIEHVYETAGEFTAQVRVQDYISRTFIFRVPVSVGTQAQTDVQVRRAWGGLIDALSASNKTAALLQVADASRDHFNEVFTALEGSLPQIAASFESLQPFAVSAAYAQYVVVRNVNGTRSAHFVEFIKDYDGLWRLSAL
jgi:hypothetical protein